MLRKLSKPKYDSFVMALRAESRTWQADHDDLESLVADCVRMALEMELMDDSPAIETRR